MYWPSAYEVLHSQLRSEIGFRLHRPHERGFWALGILDRGPRPLVLDVGANIGQSIFSIKSVLPDARIVSFEANPSHLPRLWRLEKRFSSVKVEGVALGERAATAQLYIPTYRSKPMTALASLDRQQASGWLNPQTIFWFRARQLRVETTNISIRTLDSFDLDPDFIKIDVEGAEDLVIRGGMKTIARSRPIIMAEVLSFGGAATELVETMGYMIAEFDGLRFKPYSGRGNPYLVPASRVDAHAGSSAGAGPGAPTTNR